MMPKCRVFAGLAAMVAPAAALASMPQSQSASLSVSATVVSSCEVAVSAEAPRIAAARSPSSDRLAVASCTAGEEPKLTLERAPAAQPSTGTAASDGTVYVTLTY